MKNKYQSQDFYLSSFLIASGIKLNKYFKTGRITTFLFNDTKEIQDLISDYYTNNALVNPVTYGQAQKNLKSIIHTNANLNSNHTHTHDPQWKS